MGKKKYNGVVIIAESGNSFIQGHEDDKGKSFEFFDIYFGDNSVCVSMTAEEFSEIVDMFREVIDSEDNSVPENN